jgi:hypothetical protein
MQPYQPSHLADHVLLRDLVALASQDRAATASLLAHLAEVDTRKLYRPAAYPCLRSYCMGELRLSKEAANKRIRAARTARRFPGIFPAIAAGRLSLNSVILLAAHLTEENAGELLSAAEDRSRDELERLIADRFPSADAPTRLESLDACGMTGSVASSVAARPPASRALDLSTGVGPGDPAHVRRAVWARDGAGARS